MPVLPIILHPDPRLKAKCRPVNSSDSGIRELADDMLETMYHAPGVGLAAPQVGSLLRLFVMDCSAGDEQPEPRVLVNPEVTSASEELVMHEEGCLSLPEQFEEVKRPASVQVRYTDLDGADHLETFDGVRARCAQHEIDHLDGRLFIDHLSALKRSMITRRMRKLKKERMRS